MVLIGHSQGTFHLTKLVSEQIDPKRNRRKQLLSAILLGGNVEVAKGKKIGGDFKHVGACRSASQLGCVIAFSTFDAPVPSDAIFGISANPNRDVLCTNPAALGGGSAKLDSDLPLGAVRPGDDHRRRHARGRGADPRRQHALVSSSRAATAAPARRPTTPTSCRSPPLGGAPVLNPVPDATWGLHLVDANIALGDLVGVVGKETRAYLRKHR